LATVSSLEHTKHNNPSGAVSARSFWRSGKVDFYALPPLFRRDNMIKKTAG
jgi:hypothetical protein